MYDALMKKVQRVLAETQFDLARCNDTYRLRFILCKTVSELDKLEHDADEMVEELENGE
jgi:hypothetical protein